MIYRSQKNKKSGFTLIELIITITIASIIIITVVDVFILATDISTKTDINRNMQKNIKNVVEFIAEDIRKNGVGSGVSLDAVSPCKLPDTSITTNYLTGSELCTNSLNKYYLAYRDDYNIRKSNSDCSGSTGCTIVINDGTYSSPLANSYLNFSDLVFYLSNDQVPKVTISFTARPSGKGVKASLIQDTEIKFQTTITERFIKSY